MKKALDMNIGGIKCGEDLLTENDYKNTLFLLKMVEVANEIFPERDDKEEDATMTINMDGTGKMKVEIKGSEMNENN